MTDTARVRIVLADDHPVFRLGLRAVLDAAADLTVVAEADRGDDALARIRETQPDVAVLDLEMPGLDGIAVALALQQARLPVKTVLLTAHTDPSLVDKALDSGLDGYVLKDAAVTQIVEGVRAVSRGQPYVSPALSQVLLARRRSGQALAAATPGLAALSPAERQVLKLVAQGKTSREIGDVLCISPRTVEHHRANISQKLDLRGAHALLTFAIAHRSALS